MTSSTTTTTTTTSSSTSTPTVINITESDIAGLCDGKCNYDITTYTDITSATSINAGSNLVIQCASSNITCMYNAVKYGVMGLILMTPSPFYFNGSQPQACLMIEHFITTSTTGSNNMLITCIPILENNFQSTSTSATALTQFISSMASYCPKSGENTTSAFTTFPLSTIVPQGDFFQFNLANVTYLVFGINNFIPLSTSSIQTLQSIVKAYPATTTTTPIQMFWNSDGPTIATSATNNLLYIDCSPTDTSSQFIETPASTSTTTTTTTAPLTWQSVKAYIVNSHFLLLFLLIIGLYLLNMGIKNAFYYNKADADDEPPPPQEAEPIKSESSSAEEEPIKSEKKKKFFNFF